MTRPSAALQLRKLAVSTFLAVALVLLFAETGGRAAPGEDLPDFKGFLVTGNYVVGGVDLTEETHPIEDGFSTGTIPMGNAIPADADVIAAYLFWETITIEDDINTPEDESLEQAGGVKFRGQDIDVSDILTVKRTSKPLTGSTAPCWSSGVPLVMNMFRADVLRFLPVRKDKNNEPTDKMLVNDQDLLDHLGPESAHTVTLPVRSGNQIPESAGASLFVVYRVTDPTTEPLRKIVIYDGIYIKPALNEDFVRTIQGFYLSADNPLNSLARLTHIGGSGQPNNNDKVLFNGTTIMSNPFNSPGTASQRGWTTATADVPETTMNNNVNSAGYGETATMVVKHQPANGGYDCLSWGAVIFSTAVADVDLDGLPDGLEDYEPGEGEPSVLKDPDGKDLPNLKAMGAGSDRADMFVEVNAMWAAPGTTYGSWVEGCDPSSEEPNPLCAPYSSTQASVTDDVGHHHMPTPADLRRLGDAYDARLIRAHFDVGNIATYKALPTVHHDDWVDVYNSNVADQYLVGFGVADEELAETLMRGGEMIKEPFEDLDPLDPENPKLACDPASPHCHFPAFPGTVLWKLGLQSLRDAMVAEDGSELTIAQITDLNFFNVWSGRRRFDEKRLGVFRYLLFAHSRGFPKSLPCLENGHPVPYDSNPVGEDPYNFTSCTTENGAFNPLDYHVPTSASGIADNRDALVTLGLWDEFVGRPFSRAGTAFHELGHSLELWHGGLPPIWGNKALGTANYFEPNCKPNYLSSMSYLFQVNGLFNDADEIHLDYSGQTHGSIEEGTARSDAPLLPQPGYQPAWFAPAGSLLAVTLGVTPATRFCSGEKFDTSFDLGSLKNPLPKARVHTSSTLGAIDWNGNTLTDDVPMSRQYADVNFDGTLSGALTGFNDWASIRLNQIGGVPVGALPGSLEGIEDGALIFWSGGVGFGRGGVGFGRAGTVWPIFAGVGFGRGGVGFGRGGLSHEGVGFGRGGVGFGRGGVGFGRGGQEVTYTFANEMGKTRPHGLKVCRIGVDSGCTAGLTGDELTHTQPTNKWYHRVLGRFTAPPFGEFTDYEVERKRADASEYVPVDATVTLEPGPEPGTFTLRFIDDTELAHGFEYDYRVRGKSSTGDTGWSLSTESTKVTAVNDAPVADHDGTYQVNTKLTLTVPSQNNPGLLVNDDDHDSPYLVANDTTSPLSYTGRRAELLSGPKAINGTPTGTLTCPTSGQPGICSNGAFKYTPPKGGSFVGLVTFTYRVDDGLSSNDPDSPQVPLSGYSSPVTVTINVFKK